MAHLLHFFRKRPRKNLLQFFRIRPRKNLLQFCLNKTKKNVLFYKLQPKSPHFPLKNSKSNDQKSLVAHLEGSHRLRNTDLKCHKISWGSQNFWKRFLGSSLKKFENPWYGGFCFRKTLIKFLYLLSVSHLSDWKPPSSIPAGSTRPSRTSTPSGCRQRPRIRWPRLVVIASSWDQVQILSTFYEQLLCK